MLCICCYISNDFKCSIGRAYIQTIIDGKITLFQYTTQSSMFCTFPSCTFLLKLFHTVWRKKLKSSTKIEPSLQLFFNFQRFQVLNDQSFHRNGNGRNNYTLRIKYSEFYVLHICQLYISITNFPYILMKITKVSNNICRSYAIVLRFPGVLSARLVELT